MTADALIQLVQTFGSASAILVASLLALRHVHAQLTEVQEKRIADAQLATTKLLELVAAQHEHQDLLARAIEANADAVRELRLLIEAATAERGVNRLPLSPRARRGE